MAVDALKLKIRRVTVKGGISIALMEGGAKLGSRSIPIVGWAMAGHDIACGAEGMLR